MLEVLGGSSVEEMRSGIERCCELSSDSCFMVKRGGYKFSLVHFSGECEYSIREHWLHANTVHMCDARLRSLLQSSSSSVLVEMAQVRCLIVMYMQLLKSTCMLYRTWSIVLMCYRTSSKWSAVNLLRELNLP